MLVRLDGVDVHYVLRVVDDGRGLRGPDDSRPHLGLRMLGDLTREAGGELTIDDAPGGRTSLELRLPRAR